MSAAAIASVIFGAALCTLLFLAERAQRDKPSEE